MKKHIIASVKVVIGFFLFYTFMFCPSQRVMDWLDESLETLKAS